MKYANLDRLKSCLKSWCQQYREALTLVFLVYSIGYVALQQAGELPPSLAVPLAVLWCVNLALCLNGKN